MRIDIQQQWDAVMAAPVLYIGAIIVVAGVIWLIVGHMKASRIESLEERIRLRDDEIADYKRKLEGASPDEAASRIAEAEAKIVLLEQTVARLQPKQRTIQSEDGMQLINKLKNFPKEASWQVGAKAGDSEAYRFASEVLDYMKNENFQVYDTICSLNVSGLFVGCEVGHLNHVNGTPFGSIMVQIGEYPKN